MFIILLLAYSLKLHLQATHEIKLINKPYRTVREIQQETSRSTIDQYRHNTDIHKALEDKNY